MTREVALLRPAGLVLAVGFFVPLFLFPPIRRTLGEPGFTPSPSDSSPSETIELTPGDPATPPPVVDTATCPAGHLHPILARSPDRPLAKRHREAALVACPWAVRGVSHKHFTPTMVISIRLSRPGA
jgi:hypothetical protein